MRSGKWSRDRVSGTSYGNFNSKERQERILHSNQKLIQSAFCRMMIVNMFVMMASCLNSFIDNLIVSRLLGTEALAATGYFAPVATAVGFYNMIVLGVQVLCGNFIGAGKKKEVSSLFMSAFAFLGVLSTVFAITGIVFRNGLSTFLGARGTVHWMLSGYIAGYMPGIPAQALVAMLMALVSYNNDMRRSYISAAVMAAANAVGDLLLSGMGTFGIGLASTISSLMALFILLPGYLRKDRILHFTKSQMDGKVVLQAARRGVPSLLFTAGLLIKNALMNYTLSTCAGASGVAVANVLGSVCSIIGIVSGGFGTAYLSLAGLYYGEEDRSSFIVLFQIAFRIGETCFLIITAAIMLSSSFLSTLFFTPATEPWEMGKQMFLLGFLFYPFNILYSCLLNSNHAQDRMTLVNVLSVVETALIGVTAALTVPWFGMAAAWLANTWVDVLCVSALVGYGWITKKKADFKAATLLALSDSFGASLNEIMEYSVKSMDDVTRVSESVVNFCKERGVSSRTAFFAGICVEEMSNNIFRHGSRPGKSTYVDVRVVVQEDLTIRIRDNCPEFDPRKRIEMFHPESPEQNIGIRLTAGLARQIDFYNNAGINTLLMKI